MRGLEVLVMVVGVLVRGGGGVPAKLTPTPTPTRAPDNNPVNPPVLIKRLANVVVQVSNPAKDQYGVQVFHQEGKGQVPSRTWTVPAGWRPPGLQGSRIVHAELLDTGDVVVVLFNLDKGLDLVLLTEDNLREVHTIVFPNTTSPWHPTPSTTPPNRFWSPTNTEVTTPSTQFLPNPEKAIAAP